MTPHYPTVGPQSDPVSYSSYVTDFGGPCRHLMGAEPEPSDSEIITLLLVEDFVCSENLSSCIFVETRQERVLSCVGVHKGVFDRCTDADNNLKGGRGNDSAISIESYFCRGSSL